MQFSTQEEWKESQTQTNTLSPLPPHICLGKKKLGFFSHLTRFREDKVIQFLRKPCASEAVTVPIICAKGFS